MQVKIKFSSSLRKYNPTSSHPFLFEMPGEMTVQELLNHFRVLPGEVGLIIVNGEIGKLDTVIRDGDSVELYPLVGGG